MTLSARQIEQRRTLITASEVAAVMGISPWQNAAEVWAEKVHGRRRDETWQMRRGVAMEPLLLSFLTDRLAPLLVRPAGHETATSDRFPWLGATLDGQVYDGATVTAAAEAKSADVGIWGRTAWIDEDNGEFGVPDHYLCQVQTQMTVRRLPRAYVVAEIIGEDEPRIFIVDHDEELEGHIVEQTERFWRDHVMPKKEPPVKDYAQLAMVRPRQLIGKMRPATTEMTSAAALCLHLQQQMKELDARLSVAKKNLCEQVGDYEGIEGDDWRLLWKEQPETVVRSFTRKAHRHFDLRAVKPRAHRRAA